MEARPQKFKGPRLGSSGALACGSGKAPESRDVFLVIPITLVRLGDLFPASTPSIQIMERGKGQETLVAEEGGKVTVKPLDQGPMQAIMVR